MKHSEKIYLRRVYISLTLPCRYRNWNYTIFKNVRSSRFVFFQIQNGRQNARLDSSASPVKLSRHRKKGLPRSLPFHRKHPRSTTLDGHSTDSAQPLLIKEQFLPSFFRKLPFLLAGLSSSGLSRN